MKDLEFNRHNFEVVIEAYEELKEKYVERGMAMQETGAMVRSLYDSQGNNKVLLERLKKAHERIVELEKNCGKDNS